VKLATHQRESASGWRGTTLGDFISLQRGHDLPEYERRPGEVPVMGSFGITGRHDEARASGPGVTIGRSGASFGVVSYSARDYWPLNTCLYVTDFHGNDPRFAYYLMKSIDFGRYNSGSAQPSLNRNYIRDVPVRVPSLLDQRRIAATLGAFDDKIDLNYGMNRTLESIARAIFKSWLVDFDPVRRKVEGGDVGLPLDIAALFPETMETTTTGVVPSGWRLGVCADSFTVTMGQSPPGDTYNEDGVGLPFYQGRRDFGERFPTRRVFCSAPSRLARRGDTLVSVRAPVGDINIAIEKCCIGRGLAAVRHQSGAIMYTYEAMRAFQPQFEDFEAGGTVFGSIGGSDFRHLPMVIPPLDVVQAYEDAAHATGVALVSTHRESHYLTLLRDSLLPALMNGEMSSAAHAFADRTLEVQT
jgi:type I restriction enzyme S subunit